MIKPLAIAVVLLLGVACGSAATPTLEPTAEPAPSPTPTMKPTATAEPAPSPTPTMKPTATSTPVATPAPPVEHVERLAGKFDSRLDAIREKMVSVEPVWTVYFHSDDWQTPGKNTLMNDVFELLKLENIATHEGNQRISPEMITAREPDIIIADSIESVVENPDLSGLHMVQDPEHIPDHIFVLSEGYSFSMDSHHFMDAVEEFAAFVYPEVFAQEEKSDGGHGHEKGGKHSH